jgi:hypothetical protein
MAQTKNDAKVASTTSESSQELVAHLVRVSGRRIESRQDITDYFEEVRRSARRRTKNQHVKNLLLALLLVVSSAQYYFIDVQLQILAQPSLTVFVPVKGGPQGPQRPYI